MGTAGRAKAPWEDYGSNLMGHDSAEMDTLIRKYAENRYVTSSAQNQEELARQKEINYALAAQYRFLDPADYEDIEARIGQVLTHEKFIDKLRDECRLKCFYREMGHPQMIALWGIRKEGEEAGVISWCQRPAMIELEIPRFDDKGVPSGFRYRGWRTCLMDARRKGFLTEAQIKKAFGEPHGPAARTYLKFMHSLRQNYE